MNQFLPILLAADWGDALKAIAPLLVLAYWIFSALSEAKKQVPAEPKARPRPQPVVPAEKVAPIPADAAARGGVAGPVAKPVEDNVRAEVEEFLRRVRGQGDGERRPAKVAEGRRPRIEVLVDETDEPAVPAQRRPLVSKERQTPPPLRRTPTVPAGELRDRAPISLPNVEPVPLQQRHLAESGVAEHARHMGEQFGQADDRMQAHLHRKFDHNLGALSAREATPAEQGVVAPAATPAENIAALLATPLGMQQAIILSEIMHRPTHRW